MTIRPRSDSQNARSRHQDLHTLSSSLPSRTGQNLPLPLAITSRNSSHGTTSSVDKNYAVKDKKKKTLEPVKIMLISESDNVSVVTMDEAVKIAHKRGLELRQLDNTEGKVKTEKQVFKLMRLGEEDPDVIARHKARDVGPEGKVSHTHKDVKTLIVHDKIGEHDLMSKVKSVSKWIQKGHKVNVFINSNVGGSGDAETIFQTIEKNIKEYARVFNKQKKGKDIRFQIEPPTSVKASAAATKSTT